jgi:hypothetical protein
MPQITTVLPIFTKADPSAVLIDDTLIAVGLTSVKLLPSGLTFLACNQ